MKKYELLELLANHYKLDRSDSFISNYSSDDMSIRVDDYKITIFDKNTAFGTILSTFDNKIRFTVFIESSSDSYISKIYNYNNSHDTDLKDVNVDDILNTYSNNVFSINDIDGIIGEIERLFKMFKIWNSNVYTDDNISECMKSINDNTSFTPKFSVTEFAFSFTKQNRCRIGLEFINYNKAILEYSSSDEHSIYNDDEKLQWKIEHHVNNINEIVNYLESKNVKVEVVKMIDSCIMLLDLTNKDTTIDYDDKYNDVLKLYSKDIIDT